MRDGWTAHYGQARFLDTVRALSREQSLPWKAAYFVAGGGYFWNIFEIFF